METPDSLTKEKDHKDLSKELKEVIFSEKTADAVYNICTDNGIKTDRISKIAQVIEDVLTGLLPPDKFQETIEKTGIEAETAEKIALKIKQTVFSPVEKSLASLYKTETPSSPPIKDTYRESIE
ncbi:hypothetical protein KAR26_00760 [Candidatus Parcubacteria bacterium]|nr:hypothetical protein [Candidatus Parcubacteria bacterium]